MNESRVASRYAKSLVSLAKAEGQLEEVHDDMQLFSAVSQQNRDFRLMLRNPIISHEKKLAILRELFQDQVSKITNSFFEIITRKNRENLLASIADEFHLQYNALKGVEMAKVSTVFPLDDELRSAFKTIVKQVSRKPSVELKEEVDKDLIGGFVLKIGDRQVDDSLEGKLKELRLKFKDNPYIKEF